MGDVQPPAAVEARVRELFAAYEPPGFAHVPDPDAALFLCAVDHRSGYERAHSVGGSLPVAGSELMWAVALAAAARRPGLLTAASLTEVTGDQVAELFRVGGETVADPGRRAELWRDLAAPLLGEYGGRATGLLAAADGRLGGGGGLLARLARCRAYSDPLQKKAQLYAKICHRRGWFEVADPECWEVSADNVLMRLALRSGLVEPGGLDEVRAATRAALKRVAERTGISPPLLDDMLWELGREDPDLLGREAGDLREPSRDPDSAWY
ncbi:MAG: hypothetical protein QOI10_619 [Solirubrobacterales bacterium]|jgi:hypothetical protein|nr:hypothetical protein [Solirubrobacterales bacterium]